jgi:hypothetical protein
MRSRILLWLLVLLVAACGEKKDDALSHYDITDGGFSITVPDTWHATISSQMDPASFRRFLDENPALAPYTAAAVRGESPFRFFAWDPSEREEFLTNLNVSVSPIAPSTTPEEYRRQTIAGARSIAVSGVEATSTQLPVGSALRLSFEAEFQLDRRHEKTVATVQYAFMRDGQSYVITGTTLPQFAARYAPIFRDAAMSFELTNV